MRYSLDVEVGFGAGTCGAGCSFQIADRVWVQPVFVFTDAGVWDSAITEGDSPVGVFDLLESATVTERAGFDWRVLAGHAEDVGHHAYAAFVELFGGEFAHPFGGDFELVAHRLVRPYGLPVRVMKRVLPVSMSSPLLALVI